MKENNTLGKNLTGKTPIKHLLLIMRTTLLLLFTCVLCSMAETGFTQNAMLTNNKRNVTIREVINEIEKQSDYLFIYNNRVNTNEKVTVKTKQKAVSEALNSVLEKEQNNLLTHAQQKKKQITGIVVDAEGLPIIGANIIETGTTNGTVTDIGGNFTLNIEDNASIQISYIGYFEQDINTTNRTHFNITLLEDTQTLDELVVVGYGTIKRRELTSAISHISSEDFLNVSSIDPAMMIQGKVSGVSITNIATGDPNNQANIQIRGISSRSAGLNPLIVIDGIPGGNLTNINSNDIESIDILKDGAASAIYGTRGSNGVVLITTKKGTRDGQTHTSYNSSAAFDIMKNDITPLNAKEFKEHVITSGRAVDMGSETNWIDEVSRTGFLHQHNITVSGGSAKSNYRGSINYRDANGIDLRSSRKEYGARFSLNHTTSNGLISFMGNIAPRVAYRTNSDWGIFKTAFEANPTTPVMNPENPLLYQSFVGQAAGSNPVEILKLEESGGDTKLLDWDATIKLNLLPLLQKDEYTIHSLNTQITFAEQQNDNFNYWFRPSTSTQAVQNGRKGEASRNYSKGRQQSLEWIANHVMETGGHRLRNMIGYSHQYFLNQGMSAENKDFPSDILTYNSLSQGEWAKEEGRNSMGSYKNDARLIAFFGRISYDYLERYLLTLSLRREGSSKYGKNNKWGYFPAASIGWRVSEESFLKKDVNWINDLKFRADIGVTGNQDFGSYMALSTMQGFGSYYYDGNYFTVWGPARNPNYSLKWEKAINWNLGMDFSMFENRVNGSINYYNRKQQDLLGNYNVPSPPFLFSSTFVNVGTMRNTGFELDMNINVIQNKKFGYNIDFVGSTNNNTFLSFSNNEYVGQDYYSTANLESPNNPGNLQRIEEGERLGNYFTWAYAGVDEQGDWLVWNKDNSDKISIHDATEADKRITGNGLPTFTTSLTNTFTLKNWDLTVFLRGAFGYDLYNVQDLYWGLQTGIANVNKNAFGKNKAITNGNNVLTDYFMEKGDYLKLDVVTLGYRFNMKNIWLNSLRLYVTGRNLATFTKFTGVDPATIQTNGITPGVNMSGGQARRQYFPASTQLSFGLQLDF